jgi:hypothetical protein
MEHSEFNAKDLGIAADSGTPRSVHAIWHTFFSDFHKLGEFFLNLIIKQILRFGFSWVCLVIITNQLMPS